jgi:hypothetical protein
MVKLSLFIILISNVSHGSDLINFFRKKPTEVISLEYYSPLRNNISSSSKSYFSSEQNNLQTSLGLKQKTLNTVDNSILSTIGSRTIQEKILSLSSSYELKRNGVLNSLTPSVFAQKQTSEIESSNPAGSKRYENQASIFGAKIEYDVMKNGERSNGYLQNQRTKALSYQQYVENINQLNSNYRQLQQNLLNLYSLNCRLLFTLSNQDKLGEAQEKIDLAFKINMVTYSHVLNIRELLNSNEAQKQTIENDLNRLINYFNSIQDGLGEELLSEVKNKLQCEFTNNFISNIIEDYKTDNFQTTKGDFLSNYSYHANLSSLQLAESTYTLIKNKILPDFKPYLQVSNGTNNSFNKTYDDKAIEIGLNISWGLDPSTIRNEIMAQAFNKESSRVRFRFTEKIYNAEVSRLVKSIELRKKLIVSAQKALQASDDQIKYNESQKGVKNIDTLTMINGFRTRIQSVTTLVDAFVSLEQDYTELKIYSDWKFVENNLKQYDNIK